MPYRAVLFDFDGTLADSFAAITASTNHVRASYGLPPLPEGTIREYVGYGLEHLLRTLVPGGDPAECVRRYRSHHPTVMKEGTRLFPGVADAVRDLRRRGYALAVCSNKKVAFTLELLAHFGLADEFAAILGPDSPGVGVEKPDPRMLFEALSRAGVSPQEALYVGDMAIDVKTARAAGVAVWLVLGGAAGREDATAAGPDRVLGSLAEVSNLLPARVDGGPVGQYDTISPGS